MAIVADLHVHTTNSDGTLTIDAIPPIAQQHGLGAVAITDHDRLHPDLTSPVSTTDGVTLIHGIELKVQATERIDLLGYGVDPTPALTAELHRIQQNRIDRGTAIIECVEDHLGVALDLTPRAGLGRPHIARAIADHPDTTYDYQRAFDDLIGDGRPCYVPRDIPSFDHGRRLLAETCAIVALAHPLRYDHPEDILPRARELDAIERWYPYNRDVDYAPVDRALDKFDLLPTGGSDTHNDTLGRVGLTADPYQAIRDRLPDTP